MGLNKGEAVTVADFQRGKPVALALTHTKLLREGASPSPLNAVEVQQRGVTPKIAAVWLSIILVLATLCLLLPAPSASASAYSCTQYGRPPSGSAWFCADTQGSGLYVRSVGAGFNTSAPYNALCNTRVRVQFVDSRGQIYRSMLSSQQNSCVMYGAWRKWTINSWVRAGHVRYILLSNGAKIAEVRHTIK